LIQQLEAHEGLTEEQTASWSDLVCQTMTAIKYFSPHLEGQPPTFQKGVLPLMVATPIEDETGNLSLSPTMCLLMDHLKLMASIQMIPCPSQFIIVYICIHLIDAWIHKHTLCMEAQTFIQPRLRASPNAFLPYFF